MYHTANNNQAKFPDSQENMATTHKRVTKQPVYNDIVVVQEKEIEAFLTNNACNKRLAIINLTLNKIKFKGYWRASHSYIAELLNVSSDYVQETLSRSMSLGIIRSKRTFNGSSIYTYNSEFTKSSIIERLRPYFPGMRSLLSLLSLLSSLPNCTYSDSIHAEGRRTRTSISGDLRSLSNSYNYNINPQGNGLIGVNLKTVNEDITEKPKEETFSLSTSFEDYARVAIRNKSLSNPPKTSAQPPQISQAELMRKRSQAFMDSQKEEQVRRSPKRLFPGLTSEFILIALKGNMTPWEAMLMTSIPAQYGPQILIEVHKTFRNSKISSQQACKFLKKAERERVIHVDVFNNPNKIIWYLIRKEVKKLGLKLDYELATMARYHFGIIKERVLTMQEKSHGMQALSGLIRNLDAFDKMGAKEFSHRAKELAQIARMSDSKSSNHIKDGDKQRGQHKELVQYQDFKEDGIEEDRYREDGVYSEDENQHEEELFLSNNTSTQQKPIKETIISNNSPALAPESQCKLDIANYRKSLSNMSPFLNPVQMRNNWNNELKFKFPFLPTDFDILTYQI